eukprot:TRINITY_DN38_c0_g1_i2.p1 TRINITY_DN38_c0_g1~~TRINITY_DN38_c0_g1_i2.p1  ORF type:complete len:284 (+),score=89.94 TRINITY_DN38_c0_g1_i2:45-854(+)
MRVVIIFALLSVLLHLSSANFARLRNLLEDVDYGSVVDGVSTDSELIQGVLVEEVSLFPTGVAEQDDEVFAAAGGYGGEVPAASVNENHDSVIEGEVENYDLVIQDEVEDEVFAAAGDYVGEVLAASDNENHDSVIEGEVENYDLVIQDEVEDEVFAAAGDYVGEVLAASDNENHDSVIEGEVENYDSVIQDEVEVEVFAAAGDYAGAFAAASDNENYDSVIDGEVEDEVNAAADGEVGAEVQDLPTEVENAFEPNVLISNNVEYEKSN